MARADRYLAALSRPWMFHRLTTIRIVDTYRSGLPFVALDIVRTVILVAFPSITLVLVRLFHLQQPELCPLGHDECFPNALHANV